MRGRIGAELDAAGPRAGLGLALMHMAGGHLANFRSPVAGPRKQRRCAGAVNLQRGFEEVL